MSTYHRYRLDNLHWKRLRMLNPQDVAARSGAVAGNEPGCYEIAFLGRRIRIDTGRKRFLSPQGKDLDLRLECALSVMVYLIGAQRIPLSGRWVSARDFSGGDLFFRGPHAFPTMGLENRFGRNREGFLKAGIACGGSQGDAGDASVRLPVLPRIPVRVILWLADDDFPARISFLFDATMERHLALDGIYALVSELCFRLEEA